MSTLIEIIPVIFPMVIVCAVAVLVIKRMKSKYEKGKLGRKQTNQAQILLDTFIPLGMLFGVFIGMLSGILFTASILCAGSLRAGIGLLVGYAAYELYS